MKTLFIFLILFLFCQLNQTAYAQAWDNQIIYFYPADNQFYVGSHDSIVIQFSKPVGALSGNLYLCNSNAQTIETIPLTSGQVTHAENNTLIIRPQYDYYYHWTYSVKIDSGAFGEGYPGIHNDASWNFTPSFYLQELMHSTIANYTYKIFISLPEDYKKDRAEAYPAVYFTDGNSVNLYSLVNQNYAEGKTPAAVCVGIGYLSDQTEHRMYDMAASYCPGQTNFLGFIKDELIPYVESQYHIDPKNRTYFGSSIGGSFGFYMFCHYENEVNRLFHNYICADPALWDANCQGRSLPEMEANMSEAIDSLGVNLFITAAEREGNRPFVEPVMNTLQERSYNDFGLTTWVIPNSTHNSTGGPTLEKGIVWALNNPEDDLYYDLPSGKPVITEYIPIQEASPDTLIKSEQGALEMVEACYNIQKLALFGTPFQLIYNGLDDLFLNEYADYDNYRISGGDQYLHPLFTRLFAGYNLCNKALAGLLHAPVESELKNRLIAEVKFCRALLGFYALHIFKDFPAPDNMVDYQSNNQLFLLKTDRFPVDRKTSIRSQIESDLSDAVLSLPVNYAESDKYRASRGAAYALLGKQRLFEQNWQGAANAFQQVVDLDKYELSMPIGTDSADYVNAYLCNFASMPLRSGQNEYNSEFNKESIYEVNFYDWGAKVWNEWLPGYGTQGSNFSSWFGPHCWHNLIPSAKFVEQFETPENHPAGISRDPRLYATVFKSGDYLDVRPGFDYYLVPFDPRVHSHASLQQGYGLRKYCYPLHYYPWHRWNMNEDFNNWRVIRYSDLLLMYAEALYHLGGQANLSKGLVMINAVRNRAGLAQIESLSPEAIMHERDVEFGAEAMRFMDMVRWSKLPKPWVNLSELKNFTPGEDEYLPSNTRKILLSNTIIYKGRNDSIGAFTIHDALNYNTFTYELTQGDGQNDAHNILFVIENNTLKTVNNITAYTGGEYKILVKATDKYGESRTQSMTLNGTNQNGVAAASGSKMRMVLFPNPVSELLTIKVSGYESPATYHIEDLNGKQVLSDDIKDEVQIIPVVGLRPGLYIVRVQCNNNVVYCKLVKL